MEKKTIFRDYNPSKDRKAAFRIWREVGWMQDRDKELDLYLKACRGRVAEINGDVECLVIAGSGEIRYLREDIPFSCILGVTTSWIARKQGLAGRLTARSIAEEAAAGAPLSLLGMFEQGYYDKLGYGSGPYQHFVSFDPARLDIGEKPPLCRRFDARDWKSLHEARLKRHRTHGSCNIFVPEQTMWYMNERKNAFGLGYSGTSGGSPSHFFWVWPQNMEHGPFRIMMMVYQDPEQLRELLALIRGLGDQVRKIVMCEPPGIQLQDLIEDPLKQHYVSRNAAFEYGIRSLADWQIRICDLEKCLSKTSIPGPDIRFNLDLCDPIEKYLEKDSPWKGISGKYIVTIGERSGVERGTDPGLPTLEASVGAFTRMWLGVRPATGLSITDEISATDTLLERLDDTLRLPVPVPNWMF